MDIHLASLISNSSRYLPLFQNAPALPYRHMLMLRGPTIQMSLIPTNSKVSIVRIPTHPLVDDGVVIQRPTKKSATLSYSGYAHIWTMSRLVNMLSRIRHYRFYHSPHWEVLTPRLVLQLVLRVVLTLPYLRDLVRVSGRGYTNLIVKLLNEKGGERRIR